eukprot:gene15331-biopygen1981
MGSAQRDCRWGWGPPNRTASEARGHLSEVAPAEVHEELSGGVPGLTISMENAAPAPAVNSATLTRALGERGIRRPSPSQARSITRVARRTSRVARSITRVARSTTRVTRSITSHRGARSPLPVAQELADGAAGAGQTEDGWCGRSVVGRHPATSGDDTGGIIPLMSVGRGVGAEKRPGAPEGRPWAPGRPRTREGGRTGEPSPRCRLHEGPQQETPARRSVDRGRRSVDRGRRRGDHGRRGGPVRAREGVINIHAPRRWIG